MRALLAAILVVLGAAHPAAAATTVYAASIFSASGSVISPGNALGAGDGASAAILRVPGGSNLVLQVSKASSGLNTILAGTRLTANSNVQIAIGEIVSGVAVFSANSVLPAGFGPNYSLDLSTACASVSALGCSLIRISVVGGPGSGYLLDGVSGVAAAPEPSAWALMLIGFCGLAWRLKRRRRAPSLAAAA